MQDFSQGDMPLDFTTLSRQALEVGAIQDAPRYADVLPDGRKVEVTGDPLGCKDYNHCQGDNPFGFKGTCGLVSCEDVLRQFDVKVTEAELVAHAIDHDLCCHRGRADDCGGTSPFTQVAILKDHGVPAHFEVNGTFNELAQNVEEGRGVIVEVNAGVLWDKAEFYDNGEANHAIVITGVAHDPSTGQIRGFFINDSGPPPAGDSARFVDANLMKFAWVEAGGTSVVTDLTRW